MLREWIAFLDEFLRGHGAAAVAKAAVGIMSFSVLLGAVLGSAAIKSGALATTTLLMSAAGIALLHRLRTQSRELEQQKGLVAQYGKMLDEHVATYQIIDWDTTFVIDERGDAQERLRVRARAVSAELRFVRLVFGCGFPQPPRFRKRVRLSVRKILVDGTPGTSLSQTITWPRNGTMVVMIHFPEPPKQHDEVSFSIDIAWPGRCAPLVEGHPDEYRIKFAQPVQHVRYRIFVPPDTSTYSEPIGSEKCADRYRLTTTRTEEGREVVTFEAFDLPALHKVGARLELRKNTTDRAPVGVLSPA